MDKLGLKAVALECTTFYVASVFVPKEHILMLRKDTYMFGIWPLPLLEAVAEDMGEPNYAGGVILSLYVEDDCDAYTALMEAEKLKYKLNLLALRISEIRIDFVEGEFFVVDKNILKARCLEKAHAELIKQDIIDKL